jgi:hypothetical protein
MRLVTVAELVLNFAEACRALVPYLGRAVVPRRDQQQYDNWDRIAQALFESLVTDPCAFQAGGRGRRQQPKSCPLWVLTSVGVECLHCCQWVSNRADDRPFECQGRLGVNCYADAVMLKDLGISRCSIEWVVQNGRDRLEVGGSGKSVGFVKRTS